MDEYVIGLCVILFGNICISEEHVKCILQETKISKLLSMLDGLVDDNNCEDLTFAISNMLYYYPELPIINIKNEDSEDEDEKN